jgi:hypothetical protein
VRLVQGQVGRLLANHAARADGGARGRRRQRRTAVETETAYASDREFDCQSVAPLAGRVVTGCTVDGTHRTVGKGLRVEAGSGLAAGTEIPLPSIY